MATPRPYGHGIYGNGYYSRYRGYVYNNGGSTTLLFDAKGAANTVGELAGRSSLTFSLRALGLGREVHAGGASQIVWQAHAKAAVVFKPWALSQILFDAWAEHLTRSWMLPPPCEPGIWTPADPCTAGSWSASGGVPSSSWVTAAPCAVGVWEAPEACSAGVWKPRRLT
jgi:hypothetical protein